MKNLLSWFGGFPLLMLVGLDTYTQLRQKEDVEDEIYNISPIDNPIASMSRSIRATGKIHEWTEDSLNPAGANALKEGDAAGNDTSAPVVERSNYCQIMGKVAEVTGTLEAVDKYGRDSEMAYQLELRYGELANDEELAIAGAPGGTRQTATPGDQNNARKFASIYAQIDATVTVTSTATTKVALEAEVLSAHLKTYNAGGNPNYAFTDPVTAAAFASWTLVAGRYRQIIEKRLVHVIDLYVSTYGELNVALDRQMGTQAANDRAILLLDFQYLATPVLRPTRDWPIAKLGDSDKRQILRESSFAVLNSKAHGLVTAIDDVLT